MATTPKKVKRASALAGTKSKPTKLKDFKSAKPTTFKPIKSTAFKSTKTPIGRHFKVGDRVLFDYGKRKVEGTVTSTSGDRVHVDMHFAADESTPGLFRENELRSA
ncbi:hypothetical protein [Nocardia sp. NPDC023988]|uniref:hypothetical protein n=1 Tax=unclassified Nocardia TaxID=2637762 RepID=UPI0033FFA142